MEILSILWQPSKEVFTIGSFSLHWYSFFWCVGLIAAYIIVYKLYKAQGIPQRQFDPLFFYCFIGILIGARLGHCLLYEPGYFLSHPLEMVLPIHHMPDGSWKFTGYAGLASHGGTFGLMIALWLYVRRTGVNIMRVLDNIAIATPIAACFIRLGNLMNSEIVGKFTKTDFGFIFVRLGDTQPRYPAQLYEAIAYLLLFFIGRAIYSRMKQRVGTGFFFGYCLTSIFTFRLLVEFIKEVQEPWEISMQQAIGLDQGQLLSLPFILIGLYCMLGGRWCKKLGEKKS